MGFQAGGASPDNVTLELDTGGNMRIKDGGVSNPKIANNAVDTNKLGADSVQNADIQNNAVDDNKIGAHITTKITSPLSRLGTTGTSQGDIIIKGATEWERLAAGASGKFLKSQGAGANPTYDDVVNYDGGGDNAENYKILGAGVFNANATPNQLLKTISITAAEFTVNDALHIICGDIDEVGSQSHQMIVEISGTGITTTNIIDINFGISSGDRYIEAFFCQGITNTNIEGIRVNRGTSASTATASFNLGLANWITGAFTIKFISNNISTISPGRSCFIIVAKIKNLSAGTRGTATHHKSLAGGVFTGLASAGNLQALSVGAAEMKDDEAYLIV